MNLLYIHTHDMGRYNQMYGYNIATPAMLRVAQEGILFRQAYCAGPTCSPSRAALLTGKSPHSAGILGLAHRGFGIAEPQEHLSWHLRNNGYHAALFGMQHEIADPARLGYHTISIPPAQNTEYYDTTVASQAAEYIWSYREPEPLFLSVGFTYPHRHFRQSLDGVDPRYVMPPACLPDTPEMREDYAHYLSSVQYVDRCIDRVLTALRDTGREQDTLILLTTDHGVAFPHMKCNLYDTGIGVSLAMRIPGQQGGRVCDALVSQIDLYPTLCQLMELPRPDHLEGRSLLPLLDRSRQQVNDAVFAEVTNHAAYEPQRCVRTQRYKYIRRFDDYGKPVLPNIDAGIAKNQLLQAGYDRIPVPQTELYDLLLDPGERNNLAGRAEYTTVSAELDTMLQDWMLRTKDPILTGARLVPAGARVNPQDIVEPDEVTWEPCQVQP